MRIHLRSHELPRAFAVLINNILWASSLPESRSSDLALVRRNPKLDNSGSFGFRWAAEPFVSPSELWCCAGLELA